ncbi:MAG TPA: sugar ABC transporter ATP-binding protein [Chthoniobacterales bacterium]
MGTAPENRLEAVDVTKVFGDVTALDRVSLHVSPGEILGLIGHNGAGKSTLLRVLAGVVRPEQGHLKISGQPVAFAGPADAIKSGISTVYQELSLLPQLTIVENTFLSAERTRAGVLQRRAMERETAVLLERFNLPLDPLIKLGDLSIAARQLVEIAVAVHRKMRFLLLDEPTASLEVAQVDALFDQLRNLARREQVGILFIGHKLNEMLAVSDRITALIDGRVALSQPVQSVTRSDLIAAITGESAGSETGRRAGPAPSTVGLGQRDPALLVHGLQTAHLSNIDLTASSGRVLGLYGLVGSGRSRFLRSLIGMEPPVAGTVRLFDRLYRPQNPREAARAGVVLVTEDRKKDGFIPQLDAKLNVALPVVHEFIRFGWLQRGRLRRDTIAALQSLGVKGNWDGPMVRLSGGNQQKVLLARALRQKPKLLLLDEPTKGVDIGAKGEIHRIIRRLVEANPDVLVIVVSSEEEEILTVADDVAIFRAGTCDGTIYDPAAIRLRDGTLRALAWNPES